MPSCECTSGHPDFVPARGHAQVGEHAEVGLVAAVQPVGHGAHRAVGLERLVDQRQGGPREGSQFDSDYVVEDPPAVREASHVAANDTERARLGRGWDGHVEPELVRLDLARVVLEPGRDDSCRDAGQQYRDDVGSGRLCRVVRGQVGEGPGVEDGQQVGQLGVLVVGREAGVPGGG